MILLFSRREDGHRRSYLDIFARLFEGRRAAAGELWLARAPVFFMMIEENFALFAAVAAIRALLGRRTVGLLFRPLPALRGSGVRLAVKRAALSILKRLPCVTTLTILPFSVEPHFSRLADDWIYDPQLWDLGESERRVGTKVAGSESYLMQALQLANGRPIVAAVGRMDRSKGFDSFAQIYARSEGIRSSTLFLSCGEVASDLADEKSLLTSVGGVVVDREVTDSELLEAYAAADVVWCCYAPDYDQASGVFGRAVQLGVPVIVRSGSLIERFCVLEGVAHLAIDPQTFAAAPHIAPSDPKHGQFLASAMARRSLPVLEKAFGVDRAK